jgi:hypothetical protein
MADFVSHPLGRASVEFVLLSKPHEYWRWRDHTTTYSEFKKEMWVYQVHAAPPKPSYLCRKPEHFLRLLAASSLPDFFEPLQLRSMRTS